MYFPYKKLIFLAIGCLLALSCYYSKTNENYNEIDLFFNKTFSELLQQDLWKARDVYDSSHFLMIPMEYSYIKEDFTKISQFRSFFIRFYENGIPEFESNGRVNQLQFLFFITEFLYHEKKHNFSKYDEILNYILNRLENFWFQPAWQWKICGIAEFKDMQSRILWKLEHLSPPKNYCRAIIDEELFVLGIAGNLKFIMEEEAPDFINDILDIAYKVFTQEVTFINNGMIFQKGVWYDHPDYIYAGHMEIRANLNPKPVPGIAPDSSHSHRLPFILRALKRGFSVLNIKKSHYFLMLEKRLSNQMTEVVIAPPTVKFDCYRLTNYMDGWNGIYRYNYPTQGKGNGYGPYELSGTFLLGWWGILPSKKIKKVYCELYKKFPMKEEYSKIYIGPGTTRERNPFFKDKAPFENGIYQIISFMACNL